MTIFWLPEDLLFPQQLSIHFPQPQKNTTTGSWDQITEASQITNPVGLDVSEGPRQQLHISTHARCTFNLPVDLKLTLFGAYTYNIIENSGIFRRRFGRMARLTVERREIVVGKCHVDLSQSFRSIFSNCWRWANFRKRPITVITRRWPISTPTNSATTICRQAPSGLWEEERILLRITASRPFMGRANHTHDDRLSLRFIARTDASSKFGSNHQMGILPSVSAAWNVSREAFMKRSPSSMTWRWERATASLRAIRTASIPTRHWVSCSRTASFRSGRLPWFRWASSATPIPIWNGSEAYVQCRIRHHNARQPSVLLGQLLQLQDEWHALSL